MAGAHRQVNSSTGRQPEAGPRDETRRRNRAIFVAAAVVLVVLSWAVFGGTSSDGPNAYRLAEVERADLNIFTVATGRLEAIDVVEVSSQLSGQIGQLFADFNDDVITGARLAQIDDKTYRAAVMEAQAHLAHAEASHETAVAETKGTSARYDEARLDFERKKALMDKGNISGRETEKARANMLAAQSEVAASQAKEAVQKAAIDMANASLRKALIDLDRTVIRAPIDGVVIRRSIELGQTVAVSMEAPTLFTIAHDLREMEVHAQIDEADIGRIIIGQNVRFSVDAYPDRSFSGQVLEIRRAPEIVQNVVTYTVVITAENPDLVLLPGMTAVVRIATIERPAALLVPNAALRFEPEESDADAANEEGRADRLQGTPGRVWAVDDRDVIAPVTIGIGASDGSMTEVLTGSLAAGQKVAVGRSAARRGQSLFGLRLGF